MVKTATKESFTNASDDNDEFVDFDRKRFLYRSSANAVTIDNDDNDNNDADQHNTELVSFISFVRMLFEIF